jgi:DNA polymerase elongation subunit (family B)
MVLLVRWSSFSLPIAETTIVLGAKYLTMAKDLIQERYSDLVQVVYGDTDSVFLRTVDNISVPEAIKFVPVILTLMLDLETASQRR